MDTTRNNTKEIIAYLETKFNGDEDHDVEVIQEYCRSLDRTKDNVDIVMALGRYSAEKFPNAKAVQNAKKIEEAFDLFQKKLQSAQELLKEKKFEEAVAAYDELIGENTPVESDEKHYYCFGHPFEETLCKLYYNDDKPIERISSLPMALYYQKASALFDLKRYDEAKAAYEHCTKLNPVDVRTWLELAQIAKAQGNYDEVRSILKKIHPFIYTRHFLARFYREQAALAMSPTGLAIEAGTFDATNNNPTFEGVPTVISGGSTRRQAVRRMRRTQARIVAALLGLSRPKSQRGSPW